MAGPVLTLPTVGGSSNTWGTTVNTALNQLNGYDVFARKTADQSVTSSITKVDDTHLSGSVLANGVYIVRWSLRTDGATAGDLRYAFVGPGAATMAWESAGLAAADATNVAPSITDVAAIGTDAVHGTIGTGSTTRVDGSGLLLVSSTAGTFKLQWAQGTSSATATRVLTGSWMFARQVA